MGLSLVHVELRLPRGTQTLKKWREGPRHLWTLIKAPMPSPSACITNQQQLIIILTYDINIMTIVVLWI